VDTQPWISHQAPNVRTLLTFASYVERSTFKSRLQPTHGFKGRQTPEANMTKLTLEDRIRAEQLKQQIGKLETARDEIAGRFAAYARFSVEEQLALRMAFTDNRRLLGELSRELLRLVCI
jgi:hypothetical protein